MKKFVDTLADIFAFPSRFFEKLTDNKLTLIIGMVLVGANDFLLPEVSKVYKEIFTGKSTGDVIFNAVMAVIIIIASGVIDVVFVGYPLFDIFKFLKKKEAAMATGLNEQIFLNRAAGDENQPRDSDHMNSAEHNASAIKVMKVYIMHHFIIIPFSNLFYFTLLRDITTESPLWMQNLSIAIFFGLLFWSVWIMSRGVNTLFRFNVVFRKLSFIIIFTWYYIFSTVFSAQIMNWLLLLLR